MMTTLHFWIILLLYASSSAASEVIKRQLYRQEPQTPIPRFLSENGRALPRKIESEDWLQHYKALLSQWNEENNQNSNQEKVQEEESLHPSVVSKIVSPQTKSVSYLISSKNRPRITKPPKLNPNSPNFYQTSPTSPRTPKLTSTSPRTPRTTSTSPKTPKTTSTTPRSTSTTSAPTSTSVLFSTLKNAISTKSTTSKPQENNFEITPGMAQGAAIFLTSLLGTFLPSAFDLNKSEARLQKVNPPSVQSGYAQVVNQGPRKRRRDPSIEDDTLLGRSSSIDNAMGQVTAFCDEAIDVVSEGLQYENALSDQELHSLFWNVVNQHGIPLSQDLRDSVSGDQDQGGHAQQIAVILDALCRDQLEQTTTPSINVITARPSINYEENQQETNEILVGQSFSFGPNQDSELKRGQVIEVDEDVSRRGYLFGNTKPKRPRPRPMPRPVHPRRSSLPIPPQSDNRRNQVPINNNENSNIPSWRRILPNLPSLPNILNFGNSMFSSRNDNPRPPPIQRRPPPRQPLLRSPYLETASSLEDVRQIDYVTIPLSQEIKENPEDLRTLQQFARPTSTTSRPQREYTHFLGQDAVAYATSEASYTRPKRQRNATSSQDLFISYNVTFSEAEKEELLPFLDDYSSTENPLDLSTAALDWTEKTRLPQPGFRFSELTTPLTTTIGSNWRETFKKRLKEITTTTSTTTTTTTTTTTQTPIKM